MAKKSDIGPRIGIDGEAEFRKAIDSLNLQIKTFSAELKAAATSADNETDSVKKLANQKEKLETVIEAQTKKYQALYVQMLKVTDEYGENSEQSLKMRQEVAKAETQLNKLETQLKQTDQNLENAGKSTKEMADEMDDAGGIVSKFGEILKANLSADAIKSGLSSIADGVKDAVSSIMDYSGDVETATAKVNAYFGSTGEEAEQNAEIIRSVYTNGVGESLDDVADKLILVQQNLDGLDASQIERVTQEITIMEQTFGVDASESLRGVNALMEQFGLTAEEAMDYLVAGTQNGLDKTNELGDNLSEYAGKFAQAGYSAEEYFQLLQNGLDNGAYNLDKVNDAINEVTTRLSDGTISESLKLYSEDTQNLFTAWQDGGATQKEVIDSIVTDIQNASTQQEALNLAAQAFGTMAEDGNLKFIESLTAVGDTYDDVTGKAETMVEQTETSQTRLETAFRTVQDTLSPLGDTLNNLAADILPQIASQIAAWAETVDWESVGTTITGIVDGVLDFGSFIMENGDAILAVIAGIGAGFIAWNVVSIIQGVVGAIQSFSTVTQTASIAQTALNVAMNANPIGIIITLVASIVTAIVTFIATNEDAREAFMNVWNAIVEFFSGIVESVGEAFETFKKAISDAWENVKTTVGNAVQAVKDKFNEFVTGVQNAWDTVVEKFSSAVEVVKGFFGDLKDKATEIIDNIVTGFTNFATNIKNKASEVGENIINGITGAVDYIKSLPGKFFTWGKDMIQNLIDGISSLASSVWDTVTGVAGGIADILGFSEPEEGPLSNFHTFMPDMIDLMVKGINAGIPKVEQAAENLASTLVPQYATPEAAGVYTGQNMQIVLNDGTLVGKLSPAINRTLGGYTKMQGRYKVSV